MQEKIKDLISSYESKKVAIEKIIPTCDNDIDKSRLGGKAAVFSGVINDLKLLIKSKEKKKPEESIKDNESGGNENDDKPKDIGSKKPKSDK